MKAALGGIGRWGVLAVWCGLVAVGLSAAEEPSLESEVVKAASWLADSRPELPVAQREKLARELGQSNYRHLCFELAFNRRDTNRLGELLREEPRLAAQHVRFGYPPDGPPADGHYFPVALPLLVAAQQGWTDVMAVLLAHSAEADQMGDKPRAGGFRVTALHLAAAEGQRSAAELLLAHKANPNAPASSRSSVLHYLLEDPSPGMRRAWIQERPEDQLAILRLLLQHGANIFWTNRAVLKSPLDSAIAAESADSSFLSNAEQRLRPEFLAGRRQRHAHQARLLDTLLGTASLEQRDALGNSPLHWAAQLGRTNAVLELLDRRAALRVTNRAGLTPLQTSAFAGHASVAELLLERDAELDAFSAAALGRLEALMQMIREQPGLVHSATSSGATLLHYAAARGQKRVAEYLLGLSGPPTVRDRRGQTALHTAVANGQRDLAAFLLGRQADVNLPDAAGATPLALAAERGDALLVDLLLEHHPNVNAGAGKAPTALHRAAAAGHAAVVRRLLTAGAKVSARDDQQRTPLHLAASGGHTEVAQLLLAQGADPQLKDSEGQTALARGAAHGGEQMLTLLKKAKPGARTSRKELTEALKAALDSGNPDPVEQLVAAGADPNVRSADGETALHLAASLSNGRLMVRLLKMGANINAPDGEGDTLLHQKLRYTREDEEAEPDRGLPAPEDDWEQRPITFLLEHKANPNVPNKRGHTALHALAKSHDSGPTNLLARLVGLLVAHGAKLEQPDNNGRTPLLLAAEVGTPALVEALLRHGASMDARDAEGGTPLHRVFKGDPFEDGLSERGVVEVLLAHGADPNATDKQGNTPLHCAAAARFDLRWGEDIKLLLARGAKRDARNQRGETAWEAARKAPFGDTVGRALLPAGITLDVFQAIQWTNYQAAAAALEADPSMARAVGHFNHTPLHLAAATGLTNFTALLLRYKPPLDRTNSALATPLETAVSYGHLDVAEQLAAAGASISPPAAAALGRLDLLTAALNKDSAAVEKRVGGRTPLQWAAQYGRKAEVELLLARKAAVAPASQEGFTALYFAIRHGHPEIARLLAQNGAEHDVFSLVTTGNVDQLKAMLTQEPARMRQMTPQGRTLLHVAAAAGQPSVADLLLSLRLDPHAAAKSGWTPLHEAAWHGQQETVALLVARGADINRPTTTSGFTPLHHAAMQGHSALVEWLLDHGADVNAHSRDGGTPLRELKTRAFPPTRQAIVELLQRRGGKE